MLLSHQRNCANAIKRMNFYYRHISIFVFFRVSVCSLLLTRMLNFTALRVGVQTLYNTILRIFCTDIGARGQIT